MNRIVTRQGVAHLLSDESTIQTRCGKGVADVTVETDSTLRQFAERQGYECCFICESR